MTPSINEILKVLTMIKSNPSERFESELIEFKEYRDETALHNKSQEIATELSAFANFQGGVLIVGVKDSNNVKSANWTSQLVGFEKVDELETSKRIQGNLVPAIELTVQNLEFENRNYLAIYIKKENGTLVMTAGGKCYIRSRRDSRPMTPLEVEKKIKSFSTYDWSSDILEQEDIEQSLDSDGIEEALDEYSNLRNIGDSKIPIDCFLESIGATINGKLTKGGLLFFGKKEAIQRCIGNIEYRFSQILGSKLIVNEIWSGSLWSAISKFRRCFENTIIYSEFSYDGKKYAYPNLSKEAFDEAMINSLVHRDFTQDGQISIEFTSNEAMFANPGMFYGGISPENILMHQPRHRNKALASIFLNCKLMDKAGMGTKRMNMDSLRFGKSCPKFHIGHKTVIVSLELNSIKKGIWVLASAYQDLELSELILINSLYSKGVLNVVTFLSELKLYVINPTRSLQKAIDRIDYVEIIGNKEGVYINLQDSHRKLLNAHKRIRKSPLSNKYVALFNYMLEHEHATGIEISSVLNIASLTSTQRLLRTTAFIKKIGRGKSTIWKLK